MSEERAENTAVKALVPVEQREVEFYGDSLTAVLADNGQVYVPLKPICALLGISWDGQRQRLLRDPVLSEAAMSTVITHADINASSRRPRTSVMLGLPLDYLNGWLFGVNAARVKPELQDRVIRYQRECYRVLASAFFDRPLPATASPAVTSLARIREMALAIAEMAQQQMEFEGRLVTTEGRLDRAAAVVGELGRRVATVERKLEPGNPITDEQAEEVQAAIHALAMLLTEQDKSKNHFQGIFSELHRRFRVTSYKLIPQGKYPAVLEFLQEWNERAGS